MIHKTLGQAGVTALEGRDIDLEVAVKLGIYTASRDDKTGKMVDDPRGNVVVFPFTQQGREVGRKYRAPGKKFWQEIGGQRTFWNADVLDDVSLRHGNSALIITEGEIDALSAITVGFPLTVSVPDGAPSPPKDCDPEKLDPLDPESEQSGKFEFMYNNRHRLKEIKRFIIAVDNDAPGKRLGAELVRRLSAARCSFIAWPTEAVVPQFEGAPLRPVKDMNEVLMYLGSARLVQLINEAKPYPVRGLYKLSEYPDAPEILGYPCGFEGVPLKLFPGEFMVVTGIPSHGKSTWVEDLVMRMAETHGWHIALCSPESRVVPVLRDRFRRMRLGYLPMDLELSAGRGADAWTEERFVFIDIDPTGTGNDDEPFDLDWIIDRATDAVLRDGIRVLVIDPWNEVEHARGRNESMPDYIGRGIRSLKRFARQYDVAVIVVAHPTKDVNNNGKPRIPTLYDVEGAAHWFNKCDHGVIIHRPDSATNDCEIHIAKVRFKPQTGRTGKFPMLFDEDSGRFISMTPPEAQKTEKEAPAW